MAEGRFNGKVVMITGAGGGFGRAAAIRFAAEGAKLVLSDIDKSNLEGTRQELPSDAQIFAQCVDITVEKSVISHIEQSESDLGPLDVCINNAGIGQALRPLHLTDTEEFDRIMSVNTRAIFLCMRHQLNSMVRRKSGTILNISSAAGVLGAGHMAAYAASKHAVVGLTRSAADEVARYGIRVNALCPSFAPTPLLNAVADDLAASKGVTRDMAMERVTARIPMRRTATVDEVVQAMLWAVDPENTFMTGQAISIDGGLTAV